MALRSHTGLRFSFAGVLVLENCEIMFEKKEMITVKEEAIVFQETALQKIIKRDNFILIQTI